MTSILTAIHEKCLGLPDHRQSAYNLKSLASNMRKDQHFICYNCIFTDNLVHYLICYKSYIIYVFIFQTFLEC